MNELEEIEKQITDLKQRRDAIISKSPKTREELQKILSIRTPQHTLCQLLRELHAVLNDEQKEKIEQCLLIAKKMNSKLIEYYGDQYTKDWYNKNGDFIG